MSLSKKRLVILISGRGSNMESLLVACQEGRINAELACVISNNATAAGLAVATEAGIRTAVVDHREFQTRQDFDRELLRVVSLYKPDVVILAGFMRILTTEFVRPLAGRLLNIHPSLLPKYPGLNTHQRAIEAGDPEAGATVHFVTEELDGGPSIIQVKVPVIPGDTPEKLASRILEKEHKIYTEAVKLICEERVSLSNGEVLLDGISLPECGIIFTER